MDPAPDRREIRAETLRILDRLFEMFQEEGYDPGNAQQQKQIRTALTSPIAHAVAFRQSDEWQGASLFGTAYKNLLKENDPALNMLAWSFPDNDQFVLLTGSSVFLPKAIIPRFEEITGININVEDSPEDPWKGVRISFAHETSLATCALGENGVMRKVPKDLL